MYRPNFCAECGTKIVRLRWRFWTSRSFCAPCAKRFRKERLKIPLISVALLLSVGFISGRAGRPAAPPLIIERPANSPLNDPQRNGAKTLNQSGADDKKSDAEPPVAQADVYICGARTKKGSPCSRRVHGPVRCWQHLGLPALLPQEKLLVKGSTAKE
jgi:hypothetical protein